MRTAISNIGTVLTGEIAVICCFADRGRLRHRVGGLSIADAIGEDGLT